jgi:hypothetical protein
MPYSRSFFYMSIKFVVGGSSTSVPGVYSSLNVANSVLTPAAAGRSVFLLGEATQGAPGSELNLSNNFFSSFDEVQEIYQSGPLVDAARQFFQNQPGATGSVFRAYIYKTNASVRAQKAVSSPVGFGLLASIVYGEAGNSIRSQIKDGQIEVKPSKSAIYLPSPAARSFKVVVNGVSSPALAVSAGGEADEFITAVSAASGLSASGGAARTTVVGGPMTADLSASGDVLTITRASGSATFSASILVGDVLEIPAGSPVSGTLDANAGAYLVTAISTTALSAKQLKSFDASAEVNASAFSLSAGLSLAAADISVNAPVALSVSASSLDGQSASLEVLENSGSVAGLGLVAQDSDLFNILVNSTSSVANISASVPAAGQLNISLSAGSFSQTPKAGDVIRIARGSLIAGATLKNVGLMVVVTASAQSITAQHLFSGMTTEAVASIALNGANDVLKYAPGFVSSSIAAKRIDGASERKVVLEASDVVSGASVPTLLIGGNVALEMSYYNGAATAASVSIDAARKMTIDLTGSGLTDLVINTKKYSTLQSLVDYLNAQPGFSARVPDPKNKTLPTSVLDMVSNVGILSGISLPSYPGKIKKDYYDWKDYFANNLVLVDFVEGGMSLKAGLPAAESVPGFLAGGVLGGSSNASCQAGLDAALKVNVKVVVPLFSRDAFKDIDDGLTDESSTYTIDSIHAQVQAHVNSASADLVRKYRFGAVSFDGSYADTKLKVGGIADGRVQFFFQRSNATNSEGSIVKFLPWMEACAVWAYRLQSVLGTPMLRKSFLLSSAEHIGDASLFSDSLAQDFDPEDYNQLQDAIDAGLVVLASVPGFGVTMLSPDLSSRSRVNDPKGYYYERISVELTADEVRDTVQLVLENLIGSRTSDISEALVRSIINDTLASFVVGSGNGALLGARVDSVVLSGNGGKAKYSIKPAEAFEYMVLEATVTRDLA